ncbi:MAG TPA: YbaB/EbfC family nucleoid-associated protein [Amycolatopsis sp.]|jgi:DNA-binding protein YbaB|nr:YbaB/EbfC family nucleoid-associated protein [Amycolatopsis sp.]
MASVYDKRIDELMESYRKHRAEAVQLRQQINEITATVTASRQALKVTVTAQGEVTAIEFPTGAYHQMPPKELSDLLIKTIGEARQKAVEEMSELMSPRLPNGVTFAGLLRGEVTADAVLPEEPPMPEAVREYVEHGRVH